MKLKAKAAIFLAAVLISLVGFSLIAAPAADVIVIGKEAGYEIISNFLAKADSSAKLYSPIG